MFAGSVDALSRFTTWISTQEGRNDMDLSGAFLNEQPTEIADTLPVISPSFNASWVSPAGEKVPQDCRSAYSKHQPALGYVFDANALGQYLGGVNGRELDSRGYISDRAVYQFDNTAFVWRTTGVDGHTRPYMIVDGEEIAVGALHIHRKQSIPAFTRAPYTRVDAHAWTPGYPSPELNF